MKKKSFIVHDKETGEEILIASASFCYAVVNDNTTVVNTEDQSCSIIVRRNGGLKYGRT